MNKLHFTPVHPGDVLQDELEEAKEALVPKWQ
jgi:plasmid maintenance system antidote protein VapI